MGCPSGGKVGFHRVVPYTMLRFIQASKDGSELSEHVHAGPDLSAHGGPGTGRLKLTPPEGASVPLHNCTRPAARVTLPEKAP